MKKVFALFLLLFLIYTQFAGAATTILIDGETPATGSDLGNNPLVTSIGTITFTGEFRTGSDPEATAAGSTGNIFDGAGSFPATASFSFDFDVCSISFVYGGNGGEITVEARDAGNALVNSFFQASTDDGEPAGPQLLTAANTRTLTWTDTAGGFVFLDNIQITSCDTQAIFTFTAQQIPTLSLLGLISMILVLGLFGSILIHRK